MKFQFEGFNEGDKVEVSFGNNTLIGVLHWMEEGESGGKPLIQCDLIQDHEETTLLESGPGSLNCFSFSSIKKLEDKE